MKIDTTTDTVYGLIRLVASTIRVGCLKTDPPWKVRPDVFCLYEAALPPQLRFVTNEGHYLLCHGVPLDVDKSLTEAFRSPWMEVVAAALKEEHGDPSTRNTEQF